ncbi:hypothetical protein QZH41_019389 [Actinostola sp. cb2023]|nr:hypothetical protein QZH41_019389 [Actinostola sp. cb2023]
MSKEADVGYLSLPESPKRGPSKSQRKSIPESPVRNAAGNMKNEETTAEMNVSLSKTKPQVTVNEQDEMLGDMSFLIDISSMISSFMSDPVPQQLELPLMQARERADARKLATLFNLHISIGNKMESRSSLILSKTSNSRMPKPGKLDNLLKGGKRF